MTKGKKMHIKPLF